MQEGLAFRPSDLVSDLQSGCCANGLHTQSPFHCFGWLKEAQKMYKMKLALYCNNGRRKFDYDDLLKPKVGSPDCRLWSGNMSRHLEESGAYRSSSASGLGTISGRATDAGVSRPVVSTSCRFRIPACRQLYDQPRYDILATIFCSRSLRGYRSRNDLAAQRYADSNRLRALSNSSPSASDSSICSWHPQFQLHKCRYLSFLML